MSDKASLSFIHYGPPVPKGRPRFFNGHAVTPARTRQYEAAVRKTAQEAVTMHDWEPVDSDCDVQCIVFRQAKRGDIENFSKAVLDSMNGVVWTDDRHVASLFVERFEDKTNPRVEITVRKR